MVLGSFAIRWTRAPITALIRGPIIRGGSRDLFSYKRSFHPLIAWSVGGKVIVRYARWILGRVGIEMLRKSEVQANMSLSDRIKNLKKKNPFRLLAVAILSKTSIFVIASASVTCATIYYTHLEEVPVTGRKRFNLIRSEMLDQMSEEAALQLKKGQKKTDALCISPCAQTGASYLPSTYFRLGGYSRAQAASTGTCACRLFATEYETVIPIRF